MPDEERCVAIPVCDPLGESWLGAYQFPGWSRWSAGQRSASFASRGHTGPSRPDGRRIGPDERGRDRRGDDRAD